MNKIAIIRKFLADIGMPKKQQSDICCLSLLAMAGIKPKTKWSSAINEWIRIHDIIAFANNYYKTTYAENSRETFRKQAIHHFRTAALIEDNGKANYITKRTLADGITLMPTGQQVDNLEVLILEVNANPISDFDKIKSTISEWLDGMGIKTYKIAETDLPSNTESVIEEFLK